MKRCKQCPLLEDRVGIEFESEEKTKEAFDVLFDERLPFELSLFENILIVPHYVKKKLQEYGFKLNDVEIINMVYLDPEESSKIRKWG